MSMIMDATDASYVGPTYNLSLTPYQILLRLKSLALTAGFRVVGSGDGDALFSDTADVLDSDTVTDWGAGLNDGTTGREYVAGSLGNERAWFVLATPLASSKQGYRCVQVLQGGGVLSQGYYLRIKDSLGGFDMTTASADTTPEPLTAGDERIKEGDGTDASPTPGSVFTVNAAACRVQIVAETDPAFPFLSCLVSTQGTNTMQFWFCWDHIVAESLNELDTETNSIGWVNNGQGGDMPKFPALDYEPAIDVHTAGCVSFSTRYETGETCNVQLHQPEGFAGRCGTDTLNNRDALVQLCYARYALSGGSDTGFKGYSKHLRAIPSVRGLNEPINVAGATSREYSSAYHIAIPWGKPSVDPIQ